MVESHNGPEETTHTKQGLGYHIGVVTVNGWRAVRGGGELGNWGDEISINGEDGERLRPTLSPASS